MDLHTPVTPRATPPHDRMDALEWTAPPRSPQGRLDGRLEEVEAVGGGYCRLQMPLRLAVAVRETAAGHGPGALGAAMGQVAMSALGSSRACSPRPSPPTVHCMSQCPPIVRTTNVLSARSLPSPLSSRLLRSDLGPWTRGLYWVRRAYRSAVSPTLCVLIAGPVRPAPRWTCWSLGLRTQWVQAGPGGGGGAPPLPMHLCPGARPPGATTTAGGRRAQGAPEAPTCRTRRPPPAGGCPAARRRSR